MVGRKELVERNEALEKENLHLRERTNSLAQKVDKLEGQLDYYLQRIYGRSSERFENPAQLQFFQDSDLAPRPTESAQEEDQEPPANPATTRRKRAKKGKQPIPDHLPRERVEWEPDPATRTCACCTKEMERVDELVTEELVVKPPEFLVREFVQGKYRCAGCMNRNRSISKPLPPRPIEQGRPSPSLLAYIVVSKYVDHLPLYRQEQIYKRIGYELSRKTMDGWLGVLADLLRPIVEAMERQLLAGEYLQVDESTIRYIAEEKKGKSQQGYLWALTRPREEIVYHFTTSRAARHPQRFLAGFRGYLQTDGYVGYDVVAKGGATLLACLAHVRRGFYERRKDLPKEIAEILGLIGNLYAIERERETLGPEAFAALRLSGTALLADELRQKIEKIGEAVLPASKLGEAVRYARNMWPRVEATIAVPEARLDNNWVENAMRPAKLGSKNWIQLGHPKGGGKRIEVFLGLAQSCRRLGANAFDYFADVIERVSTHPQAKIEELTPRGWMQARGIPLAAERVDWP